MELEQRRQENKMKKDEFCAFYLTRKTQSQMTKDEFYAFYLKKEEWYPHNKVDQLTIIKMKRRNANINDCPVSTDTKTLAWGIMMENKMIIIFNIKKG